MSFAAMLIALFLITASLLRTAKLVKGGPLAVVKNVVHTQLGPSRRDNAKPNPTLVVRNERVINVGACLFRFCDHCVSLHLCELTPIIAR